jgi:uncharacterized repeat protein (TIGR03806 family)
MLPYSVNVALWSDGADKERFLAIPDGTTMEVGADGHLTLPVGAVLMKTFRVAGEPVETRLLMRHPDGSWGGYAYAWNALGDDALLLEGSLRVETGAGTWLIPSRGHCMQCHTAAAGRSLGTEIAQLNRDHVYGGRTRANQLRTLSHIGVLAGDGFDDPSALPAYLGTSADGAIGDRARHYLHANCAHCHRPGGPGRGDIDLRAATPLAGMGICDSEPGLGDLGVADARLLAPGAPERSVLLARMRARGVFRMPPVGSEVVDETAVDAVAGWIASLTSCD